MNGGPGPKKWARVRLAGAHNLRRGAWYPVVNDTNPQIVVLDVLKRNVPIPRGSVEVSDQRPEKWSVVRFEEGKPVPARISAENLPLTYLVCPFCRGRSMGVEDGLPVLKCDECGKEAPVDWEHPA